MLLLCVSSVFNTIQELRPIVLWTGIGFQLTECLGLQKDQHQSIVTLHRAWSFFCQNNNNNNVRNPNWKYFVVADNKRRSSRTWWNSAEEICSEHPHLQGPIQMMYTHMHWAQAAGMFTWQVVGYFCCGEYDLNWKYANCRIHDHIYGFPTMGVCRYKVLIEVLSLRDNYMSLLVAQEP